jgi:HPt (histidine-containing phosphotransfer) domain-containing protein
MVGGKQPVMIEIMNAFLKQIPEELEAMNNAILISDFAVIKSYAHTMKSSVSIMGISSLTPVLQQMEDLGTQATGIDKIVRLNEQLIVLCKQAIAEVETEKHNYA